MMNLLLQFPMIGTKTDDPTLRRMTVSPYPYLIFYEAAADEIIIHAVRHGARKHFNLPNRRQALH